MKKIFLSFILSLSFLSFGVKAESLEYELIRTPETPGFFAVRIFPGKDLKPRKIKNIFIKNFKTEEESKIFAPLVAKISEKAEVLEKEEIVKYLKNDNARIVVLGGDIYPRFLQFIPENPDTLFKDFKDFSKNFLGPVYLQNIKVSFGKNISDVLPAYIPFLTEKSTFFIGKFESPEKTIMHLKASGEDYTLETKDFLNLENFTPHVSAEALPSLWEEIYKSYEPEVRNKNSRSLFWVNVFPYLLLFLGFLSLFFSFPKTSSSRTFDGFTISDDFSIDFWNMPLEETPLFHEWEKSLPI